MKQKAKQFLAMFLAVIMVVLLVPVTSGNSTAYAETTIESVRAAIQGLSADPTDFTESNKDEVEAINADFESLSAEDQATLDKDFSHSGTGQSLGRVLESALWSVRSYETNTSTTLADGTYSTTTDPAVSSASNKGKSDSSRVRNWWVEKVVVKDGQATAYIYVTSGAANKSKLTSYPSIWFGGNTVARDADDNYAIPVDINGITYFGGISSSMATPIMYALETTIDESVPTADYTAVDDALAKVPADLSIYTDETAAAVTNAVNAVVRDKPASKQAEVDAMAQAIEDAIAALVEKSSVDPPDDAKDLTVTNNVKMLKVTGATLDKDNLVLQMGSDAYNYASVGDIATAEKDSAPIALGGGNTFTIPASTIDKTGKEFYVSLKSKKNGTWYERIFTLDETAKTLTIDSSDADYTAVNAAITSIPEDLSIYTEESVKAVNDAKDAVVEKLFKSQQAEVDAMAAAINEAVAALQKKDSGNDPAVSKKTSLYPINDEAMFKVVNAYLETKDGKTELVFALSAKGYEDVIPATYEEALAMDNKDAWASYKEAEVDCKYTAKGTETDEGVQNKYQFRVPVKVNETGKTMIPIISVSARERDNAENAAGTGKPAYSKAFMARRFIIDMDSKELHTGSYQEEMPITVTSEIETFEVEKEGVVSILGCPPANEYEAKPTITLSNQVYDKAFIGKAENVDEEKAVEVGKDGKIKLDFINSRSKGISLIDGTNPITVAFHVKETGEWIDREFVMDLANKKITITGEEIKTKDEIKETPANYNKVNEAKEEAEKIDNDLFTEDSIRELSEALSAVEENLTADKQQEVNEMANGINKAMKGLKLKDGVYTIPANSLGNDFMDVVIEVEGGKMSAYIITTSRAQDKIFQGTKEEAENSGEATEKLAGVKNSLGMPGASMFKIPLDALNDTLEFAIHSPDGWTDRKIVIKATDIKKGEYKIIENTDGEFTLGEELTLSSDADFSKFVAVIVDDEVVEPTNYDVVSGSTKVTFKKSYTETLGESSHEVQILSYDGIAKTVIKGVNKQTEPTEPETKPGKEETVKPGTKTPDGSKTNQNKNNTNSTTKRGTEAAKTGDETNVFVYLTIFIAAAISTLLVYRRKQR